ncbi:MAG: glycosyltransferase [Pirellulaceae bacterium]|nr:glycosyltransferase [Pirellulaceae bacterium]
MKIDLVITELDVGGAEQCLTNLAVYLHQHSHSVRVISLGPPPPPDRNRLQVTLNNEKIETHFLDGRHAWHSVRVFSRLRRLVQQARPDIVQSFLFHANILSAFAYSPRKVPIIGGARVVEPNWRRVQLSRIAAKRMHRIVCVSQSVANACEIRERIPREKIVVIQNGASITEDCTAGQCQGQLQNDAVLERTNYAQEQLGLAPSTPCLLFVGRLDYQKGTDALLERADRILAALPQHNLILIGDGPLKVVAQSNASQCIHEHRIHFTGRRDDVMKWMRACDLLLLPTRYEGMPNVVIEAMSCGLPIVSTRAEGVAELLGQAAKEQTVAVNDWDAWAEKVIRIASERESRLRLAKSNFERCLQQFNLADKLRQYEDLYLQTTAIGYRSIPIGGRKR